MASVQRLPIMYHIFLHLCKILLFLAGSALSHIRWVLWTHLITAPKRNHARAPSVLSLSFQSQKITWRYVHTCEVLVGFWNCLPSSIVCCMLDVSGLQDMQNFRLHQLLNKWTGRGWSGWCWLCCLRSCQIFPMWFIYAGLCSTLLPGQDHWQVF